MTPDDLLILGIGSPFGADRAAWDLVAALRAEGFDRARLETCDRPGARLLSLLEGVRGAILFDAFLCDSPPGTLHRLQPEVLAAGDRTSGHGFGVADALALGRALGTLPPHLFVVGISARGDTPPAVDGAAAIELVHALLREIDEANG